MSYNYLQIVITEPVEYNQFLSPGTARHVDKICHIHTFLCAKTRPMVWNWTIGHAKTQE